MMFRLLFAALAVIATSAQAQPGQRPGVAPLALAPGFDAATAKDVRRIEAERRDAHDQLAIRQRAEHARIDEEADDKLRKRLGDDGWRKYLEWRAQAMPPRGARGGRGPGGEHAVRGGGPRTD
ncbi:MAG TPA: hypothetical protein PKL49_11235 [Steroidobacteraceae bacterium]|nr:hypothetical protein [Steroidobacteraceae bacterium]